MFLHANASIWKYRKCCPLQPDLEAAVAAWPFSGNTVGKLFRRLPMHNRLCPHHIHDGMCAEPFQTSGLRFCGGQTSAFCGSSSFESYARQSCGGQQAAMKTGNSRGDYGDHQ